MKIFIATGNKNKIQEIKDIFKDYKEIEFLSKNDGIEIPEVVEDGKTFEENSYKKAYQISKFLNMTTIADDSGLCVEALNGEPGIFSARYSESGKDEDNNQKLLENMKNEKNRKAKFVCVITIVKENGEYFSFRGELEGEIAKNLSGTSGFGYDPLFYVKEYDTTLANLSDIKNKISHRAKALEKLKKELNNIL